LGGPNPRQHPIHLDVMGERKNKFIHQSMFPTVRARRRSVVSEGIRGMKCFP
jgi:hypothetical protein